MISQKAKYALKALVALARAPQGAAVQIRDIALGENIPRKFLEQIMLDMKRAGYVASRRGRAGGYELLKPASAITYGEILRLIDGPIAPLPCLSRIAYRRCEDCGAESNARSGASSPALPKPRGRCWTRRPSRTALRMERRIFPSKPHLDEIKYCKSALLWNEAAF